MIDESKIWIIPLTHRRVLERLKAEGITEIPEQVRLILKEANFEELAFVEAAQAKGGKLLTDPFGAYADMIQDRADPPVTPEIARAAVMHLTPAESADLLAAYVYGKRDGEGKIGAAVQTTMDGIRDQLLTAMTSATSHLSPTSTPDSTSEPAPPVN